MIRGVEEEVAVLGAILTDGNLYQIAAEKLRENDFYKEEHRLIWRKMSDLASRGQPIDCISVTAEFKKDRDLTRAGGTSYISSLADGLPDVNNVEHYAALVKKASAGRALAYIGKRLQDEEVSPESRLEVALTGLTDVVKDVSPSSTTVIGDVVDDIYNGIVTGNGHAKGIKIGFAPLDYALDGINKDQMIILGARPSVGKSSFAMQLSYNVARQGHRVLFVSPEMSRQQLGMRLTSMISGVPYMAIKKAVLTEKQLHSIGIARETIKNLPLILDDDAEQSVEKVRLLARSIVARHGELALLVVDYLQLLCAGDDSKEAVTVVSKGLKAIAKDLHIPVIALTQLSRQIEYRDDKRPKLSDIRGSGQIEQDADAVLFIWNPSKTKTEVFIEKNRNGPLGSCDLIFDKETTSFRDSKGGEW